MIVNINLSGDFINCLEVGIWVEQLLSEDGLQLHWNVINAAAIVKVAFTEIFSAVLHKNVK
jgi:hypothetical protein